MIDQRIISCRIDKRFAGMRIIDFLSLRFTYRSAAEWSEKIAAGELLIAGAPVTPEQTINIGEVLDYFPGDLPEPPVDPAYRVAYGDEYLLAVEKSGDLPTHPAGIFYKNTLWYLLSKEYVEIYPVNRLDRETSGLLLAARTPRIAALLAKSEIRKEYLAAVWGDFSVPVTASGYLCHDTASVIRKKRRLIPSFTVPLPEQCEYASTELTPLRSADGISLVSAIPVTGRTHQIRCTLFSLGYPLLGDKLYGVDDSYYLRQRTDDISEEDYRRLGMRRQALHSWKLEFTHPVTLQKISLETEFPFDFPQNTK